MMVLPFPAPQKKPLKSQTSINPILKVPAASCTTEPGPAALARSNASRMALVSSVPFGKTLITDPDEMTKVLLSC